MWPSEIEGIFNMYRVMVFFWILAGLTWLGGVVSMLTDLLNLSVSYQFDFTILKNNLRFPIIFQRILPQRETINRDYPKKVAIPPPGYSRHTSDVETNLQSKSLLHKQAQNQRNRV